MYVHNTNIYSGKTNVFASEGFTNQMEVKIVIICETTILKKIIMTIGERAILWYYTGGIKKS